MDVNDGNDRLVGWIKCNVVATFYEVARGNLVNVWEKRTLQRSEVDRIMQQMLARALRSQSY